MSLCEDKQIFTWIIENYSYCDDREGQSVKSPIFSPSNIDGDAWIIGLVPRKTNEMSEEYVYLLLVRHEAEPVVQKDIDVNIEVCLADNKIVVALDKKGEEMIKDDDTTFYSFTEVVKSEELEKRMKESLTDSLIVRCRINTGKSSTDTNRKKRSCSAAETTFVYHKISLTWNVCFGKHSEVLMKKIFSCQKSHFKTIVKAPNDDILIEIRKTKPDDDQDFKVKGQIFLLDCDEREIISKCDSFLFDHKSKENSIWHFPLFLKKSFLIDRELENRCTLRFNFCVSNFNTVEEYNEEAKE